MTTDAMIIVVSSTLPIFGTSVCPCSLALRQKGDSNSFKLAISFVLFTKAFADWTWLFEVNISFWTSLGVKLSQSPSEASTMTLFWSCCGVNQWQAPLKTSETVCSYYESYSLLKMFWLPPYTWKGTLNDLCCSWAMKKMPSFEKIPQTESPMWQLLTIPVWGCRVKMDSVDDPFSSFC